MIFPDFTLKQGTANEPPALLAKALSLSKPMLWAGAFAACLIAPNALQASPNDAHSVSGAMIEAQVTPSAGRLVPYVAQASLVEEPVPGSVQTALSASQDATCLAQASPDTAQAWQAVPVASVPIVDAAGNWAAGRLHDVRYGEVLLGERMLRLGKTPRVYYAPERPCAAEAEKWAVGKLAYAEYEAQNITRLISAVHGRSQGTHIWQAYCAKTAGVLSLGGVHPHKENFFKKGDEIIFIGRAPSGHEMHFCAPGFFADHVAKEVSPGIYALRCRVPEVNISAFVMATLKGENWEYRGDFFYHLCGEKLAVTQAGPIGNAGADAQVFAVFQGLPQAIDLESCYIEIDGARVKSRCTSKAIIAEPGSMLPGLHAAKAVVCDKAGNICEKSWKFSVR